MPTTRTYFVCETRGGPGNADVCTTTEHEFHYEAAATARRVGGKVWHVSSTTDKHDRVVRTMTEVKS